MTIKDKSVAELSELAKIWYTMGRSILPQFGTKDFVRFCAESYTLLESIDEDAVRFIEIDKDMGGQLGYIDARTKKIHISSKLFSEEIYEMRLGEDAKNFLAELAVTFFNAILIHESLHSSITFPKGETFEDGIPAILKLDERFDELTKKFGLADSCRAFNIIEDLFIESHVPENLENWLDNLNKILFRVSEFEEMTDPMSVNDYLNYAVCYKNSDLRESERMVEVLGDEAILVLATASSGKYMSYLKTRVKWSFDLLEALNLEFEESESESSEDEADETDDEENEESESDASADSNSDESDDTDGKSSDEDSEKEIKPSTGSETFEEMLEEIDDLSDEEIGELNDLIKAEIEKIEVEKSIEEMEAKRRDFSHIPELVEVDILDAAKYKKRIEPETKIDTTFVKQLKAIRTDNRAPGQARKRGSVMVKQRLTRIVTDQKIFARRTAERSDGRGNQRQERMEVIINVDLSASTTGYVVNNEIGAAYEMSKALQAAAIPHSVYGHSGSATPTVYHIYSFRMQKDNHDFENRFEQACCLPLAQNYDGFVIKHLAKKFTNRKANCFLINLSDGLPAGHGYGGYYANLQTKEAIEDVRKRGIAVFAMSVVESVVTRNAELYGSEWNVDASGNLSEQFKRLLTKLASGQTV